MFPAVRIETQMDTQKAIELIEKSTHIGILLPKDAGVDQMVSAEVLSRILEKRGKKVGFLNPVTGELVRTNALQNITRGYLLPREFIISLDTASSPISELRYEKDGERINVILSPASSSFIEGAISYKEGRLLCDTAILLGIGHIEDVDNKNLAPDFFTTTPIIVIDKKIDEHSIGEINLADSSKVSLAEILYEFLTALEGGPLESGLATLLLAGIIEQTNSFGSGHTNADSLLASSELMRLGADYAGACHIAKTEKALGTLQLFGRAAARTRIDNEHGILWSFLTAEDFDKTGRNKKDLTAVITHLNTQFSPRRLTVLLSQEGAGSRTRVLLSGNEMLEQIAKREQGAFHSPHFSLANSFSTFREAEEYINSIILEII